MFGRESRVDKKVEQKLISIAVLSLQPPTNRPCSHWGDASRQRRQEAPPQDVFYTASFAAFTGRALTILRAGFALKVIASPVKGLVPLRALVAAFLMTTNLAKPGTRNTPFFFSSL